MVRLSMNVCGGIICILAFAAAPFQAMEKPSDLNGVSRPPSNDPATMCELPEACPSPYGSWYEWYTQEAPCSWLGLPGAGLTQVTLNSDVNLLVDVRKVFIDFL